MEIVIIESRAYQDLVSRIESWKSHSTLTPLGKQDCSLWP
ncbi:hypothetical protein HMPREF0971_00003 [Segatella oris F0302]|uniref:Uncharacterized protein n=1 Tax=Segatella oris F0302 TaxID=649760 RepID=D1QM28_9BACT|nr:hypothetical protein HMPREF0971_00003 [Segatella oris F0302]